MVEPTAIRSTIFGTIYEFLDWAGRAPWGRAGRVAWARAGRWGSRCGRQAPGGLFGHKFAYGTNGPIEAGLLRSECGM